MRKGELTIGDLEVGDHVIYEQKIRARGIHDEGGGWRGRAVVAVVEQVNIVTVDLRPLSRSTVDRVPFERIMQRLIGGEVKGMARLRSKIIAVCTHCKGKITNRESATVHCPRCGRKDTLKENKNNGK